MADLLQGGKPMGAGLSDKTAGSIISVLPVSISAGRPGGLITEITWTMGELEVICGWGKTVLADEKRKT